MSHHNSPLMEPQGCLISRNVLTFFDSTFRSLHNGGHRPRLLQGETPALWNS
jgi:hypothetical protein